MNNKSYIKKVVRISLNFVLLFFMLSGFGQESNVTKNLAGKSFANLKHTWTSQWITHPAESTFDARKFLFRKTFQLDAVQEKFVIHISADNRYRLYVNEQYIVSGPSIADINHYRYETIDIAKYLQEGENVLAVEVVNFGEYKKGATMSFQTALIVQGDENNAVNINTQKDNGWKVLNDEAFEVIPFMSSDLRGYYVAGPGEKITFKNHEWNWKKVNYDDSNWIEPKLATVEFAVGRGFLYGSTWFLVPRTIPFLEETQQRFKRIIKSKGLEVSDDFITGKGKLTIPPNKKVSILIDQTHHAIGHPELFYSKGKNSKIKITYAEALYDKDWKKGDRNQFEGKQILGYFDIVETDGGNNRMFKPVGQKTYRFIQLDIETKDEPLIIDDYYGVYTAYPFKENAKFKTNNETLSKIWDASWLTFRNSATESFIDPYYEQLQYIGDTRIEALVSLSVSGDDRLMKKAIEMFDNSRLPNGLTQSRYPAYITQVIPTYSLLWIGMLHDHYMYKDDIDFIKNYSSGMKSVLDWWIDKIDETSMPTQMDWWNFMDWTPDYENGIPPGADDGYSALVALSFVKSLQDAAEIFNDLGLTEEAKKYSDVEKQVRESVVKYCYNSDKKLFAETPDKKQYSQHTNIMAILTDAIPEEEQQQLMLKILENENLIQTTIYFKFYLFEALHKVGLGDKYVGLLDNWTNQLDLGLTTFAEKDIEPRSECHAWSASPNHHFLKIVAGISPKTKHFKKVTIQPNFGDLNEFEAVMPHPKGEIVVHLKRNKNKLSGEVTLPKETTGELIWNNEIITLKSGFQKVKIN